VLVPGQVISPEILDFLIAIDVKEIHGFRAELGLRVFTDSALKRKMTGTALGGARGSATAMGGNGGSALKKGKV
jgi:arginine decarboxylase